jgi:hypothetical protein
MAKFERILSFFPWFYRATDGTKLLYNVVNRLAQPLEEADTHLFRIQRSHRLNVAEHVEDIILLAACLNLAAYDFEDILRDPGLDYHEKMALMRQRVQRIAGVHLQGPGTPPAVMESAAIYLNADIVPGKKNDPLIKHVDKEGYSHKAVIEFSHVPGKPREQIYLHENPLRRKKIELTERYPMNSWAIKNENVMESPVRLVVKGLGERTVLPCIFCPQTGEGILFNGVVPEGKTLIIDEANGAMLDRQPVDDWLTYFRGGIFDFSKVSGNEANFVEEQGGILRPFDGNLENIVSLPFREKKPVPRAPIGGSEWYYKAEEGVYDGNEYDFSLYAMNHEPIGEYEGNYGFDECIFDHPASAVVGMAWDERIPCAFKLVLPRAVPNIEASDGDGESSEKQPVIDVSRIGNILPRFKAAGIQCFVDMAKDGWILGTGVIRDPGAVEGEGVTLHATRLYGQKTDQLVEI